MSGMYLEHTIAPGLGGIKPYLSMGIPYIPPINGTVNEISLVTFE